MKRIFGPLAPFALIFSASLALLGQQDAGVLRVLAEDPSGAVVPGATVRVTNVGTNTSTTGSVNDEGYAIFAPIQRGTYVVEVTKSGFRTVRMTDVEIAVNQNRLVRTQLEVATVSSTLEVAATAAAIQTEDASLGQVVAGRVMAELPLAARRYTDLTLLSPGATESNADPNVRGPGWFVVNGNFASMNNFLLDGLDNNQNTHNWQSRSAQVVMPSPDSLNEFKLQTDNFSAEFGRAAGAVINASMRSGTNQLHGTAWWYNRNSVLAANAWASNLSGLPKAPLKWNQPGGAIGGPIKKNKLFIFGDYEAYISTTSTTGTTLVPTLAMHDGNFSQLTSPLLDPTTGQPFPGNIIPQTRWDPLGKKLVDVFPNPNVNGGAGAGGRPVYNWARSMNAAETSHKFDIRSDFYATDKNRFFGRYSYVHDYSFTDAILPGLGDSGAQAGGGQFARSYSIGASWNRILSSSSVNELRFGFNDTLAEFTTATQGMETGTQFGFRGIPPQLDQYGGLPNITISGYQSMGSSNYRPQHHDPTSEEYSDTLSKVKGAHTMKAGFDFRQKQDRWVDLKWRVPGYNFDSKFTNDGIADMLLGLPQGVSASTFFEAKEMQRNYSAFFQDDWKVRPNLTFNLGLRYEYVTPYWGKAPYQNGNLDFPTGQWMEAPGSPLVFGAKAASNKYVENPDFNNLGPRVGVSYQMNSRIVLRGGYGVFYAGEDVAGTSGDLILNPPNVYIVTLARVGTGPSPLPLSSPIPSNMLDPTTVDPRNLSYKTREPDFPAQTIQQWNATLQFLVSKDSTFEIAYVGNSGRNLADYFQVNYAQWGKDGSVPANRPYPQWGATMEMEDSLGTSHYNALQAKFERHFTKSWYNLTSFSWASGLATTGSFLGGGRGFQTVDYSGPIPQPNYNGETRFMPELTRERLTLANIYEFPFGRGRRFGNNMNRALDFVVGGWQSALIVTAKSGQPVNVSINASGVNPATGQAYSFYSNEGAGIVIRPNRVGNPNTGIDPHTDRLHFLNVNAFQLQPLNTPGNAAPFCAWGPSFWDADFSVMKQFRVTEGRHVDFRFETFNVFNHTNFQNPNAIWGQSNFGTITNAFPTRQIQLALRFAF